MSYGDAVFELWADISVVSCFFYFLIVCLYISFNKFQGVVSFGSHIFNVGFPVKVIADCDSKVFSIFSGFQFRIVKFVWENDWTFLFSNINHFTFVWVEFHGPVWFPLF